MLTARHVLKQFVLRVLGAELSYVAGVVVLASVTVVDVRLTDLLVERGV